MKKTRKTDKRIIRGAAMLLLAALAAFLIFSAQKLAIILGLFLLCLLFMVKFGQFIMLDLDPLPICSFIILYLYGLADSLKFILFALPIIDIASSRFNHYSFINFVSLAASVTIMGLLLPFSQHILLFGIILFNVLRTLISMAFSLGSQTMIYNLIHSAVFFVLGSLISFFI